MIANGDQSGNLAYRLKIFDGQYIKCNRYLVMHFGSFFKTGQDPLRSFEYTCTYGRLKSPIPILTHTQLVKIHSAEQIDYFNSIWQNELECRSVLILWDRPGLRKYEWLGRSERAELEQNRNKAAKVTNSPVESE